MNPPSLADTDRNPTRSCEPSGQSRRTAYPASHGSIRRTRPPVVTEPPVSLRKTRPSTIAPSASGRECRDASGGAVNILSNTRSKWAGIIDLARVPTRAAGERHCPRSDAQDENPPPEVAPTELQMGTPGVGEEPPHLRCPGIVRVDPQPAFGGPPLRGGVPVPAVAVGE